MILEIYIHIHFFFHMYIYIYINTYTHLYIIYIIYMYIYMYCNQVLAAWQPVQNSWLDHTWKDETWWSSREFPGIVSTCEAINASVCVYVYSPCVYCCFPFWTALSQHADFDVFFGCVFRKCNYLTYYLQSILGNHRWYRSQPQPTHLSTSRVNLLFECWYKW